MCASFVLSAFASLCADPPSRPQNDRKRAEGKRHHFTFVCLARRRIDVLKAMLKHGTFRDHRSPAAGWQANWGHAPTRASPRFG